MDYFYQVERNDASGPQVVRYATSPGPGELIATCPDVQSAIQIVTALSGRVYVIQDDDNDYGERLYLYHDLGDALRKARRLSDARCVLYDCTEVYRFADDEDDRDCLFCEVGDGQWSVTIKAVEFNR